MYWALLLSLAPFAASLITVQYPNGTPSVFYTNDAIDVAWTTNLTGLTLNLWCANGTATGLEKSWALSDGSGTKWITLTPVGVASDCHFEVSTNFTGHGQNSGGFDIAAPLANGAATSYSAPVVLPSSTTATASLMSATSSISVPATITASASSAAASASSSGSSTLSASANSGTGLSSGAKAGIGIGVAVGVLAVLAGIALLLWKRKRAGRHSQTRIGPTGNEIDGTEKVEHDGAEINELAANKNPRLSVQGDAGVLEPYGAERFEVHA